MSEIKVNKISPRTACGTTTLGDSGDTFTIPAGVTITNNGTANGFGATGAVNWQTTVKTHSPSSFTAVAGEGYFINTTGGTVTVNLPAGTAGAVVGIKDYAGTFDTNAVTLNLSGSDKAGGSTTNPIISTEGIAITLVFIDSTQGWLVTDSGLQSEAPGPAYICASVSGACNTLTTAPDCANVKIATFTGPGTFTVNSVGNAAGSNSVDYLILGGGGGGGIGYSSGYCGGAGGAGGYRESPGTISNYTASPLGASPATAITVTAQGYAVVVGGGGPGKNGCSGCGNGPNVAAGVNGIASSALGITSAGGGGGAGGGRDTKSNVGSGGSGGGGGYSNDSPNHIGGAGNTPPVSPAQGFGGGTAGPGSLNAGGGGGGATAVGANASPSNGGTGGAGTTSSITGTPVARAGGGGGSSGNTGSSSGGTGGGGAGGNDSPSVNGTNGTANTGGGGGGGTRYSTAIGGTGGSGIVVIRYKFQ